MSSQLEDILSFSFFLIAAFMVMIAIFLAYFIKYRNLISTSQKLGLIEKAALRPTLVIFFITMPYVAIVTFIALYASKRGISNIGSYFTVYAVSLAIFRPLAGRLSDKWGFDFVVIPGIILIGLAMILLFLRLVSNGFQLPLLCMVLVLAHFSRV